jgi:hypothetical protein
MQSVEAGLPYDDDGDHVHTEWKSVSRFLGLVLYHAWLECVQAKIEGVFRRVWMRGVMAQEAM